MKSDAPTPSEYLAELSEPRAGEIRQLDALIRRTAPQLEPHMQAGMLAYGHQHYRYASGREGDWMVIALASQKRYISLYACTSVDGRSVAETYADRLPGADIGKSCIRFRRVADVDLAVIEEVVASCAAAAR